MFYRTYEVLYCILVFRFQAQFVFRFVLYVTNMLLIVTQGGDGNIRQITTLSPRVQKAPVS